MARIRTKVIVLVIMAAALASCGDAVKKNDLMVLQASAAKAYAEGDWRAAEKYFKTLTERVPEEGEFWFRLGNVYARLQRPEDAVAAYKEALLRQNVKSKSWHNMGIVYLRQAANAFTQMLTGMTPEDPLFERATMLNDAVLKILNDIDTQSAPAETPPVATPELQ
ncbi:MAG TPA: tetratricopeptide repeat protein [Gammaproteobacteria bacterium]|nr:tetratricopeptide repeat protein [Gammaproteobacteria bacterium]